jgi:hypothetical protein
MPGTISTDSVYISLCVMATASLPLKEQSGRQRKDNDCRMQSCQSVGCCCCCCSSCREGQSAFLYGTPNRPSHVEPAAKVRDAVAPMARTSPPKKKKQQQQRPEQTNEEEKLSGAKTVNSRSPLEMGKFSRLGSAAVSILVSGMRRN